MESGNRIRLPGRQRVPAIFLQGLSTKGLLQLRRWEPEETRHISVSLTPAVSCIYYLCLKTPSPVTPVLTEKNSFRTVLKVVTYNDACATVTHAKDYSQMSTTFLAIHLTMFCEIKMHLKHGNYFLEVFLHISHLLVYDCMINSWFLLKPLRNSWGIKKKWDSRTSLTQQ